MSNGELCLVTGATGFLAGHVVADLLRHGYRVRGTVRDLGNTAKSAHLTSMKGAGENLELVQADLLDDDASWQKVVTEVTVVREQLQIVYAASAEDDKVDDDSIPPYFMDDGIRGSALSRKDDHMEPVTYGSLPVEFFLNVLDGLSIRDVVDITPADGNLALACIIKQRGYVGIGFTEFHCTALRSHLVDVVLECFGKDGHPLFHANYKQQIEDETEARGEKRKREEEPKEGNMRQGKRKGDETSPEPRITT